VTLVSGQPFAVESPEGKRSVSLAQPLTLKTRRPDLAPTENAARCVPSQATSEEPGLYAEAAVDGNRATVWAPDGGTGSLTADLMAPIPVSRIAMEWNDAPPASFQVRTSLDGERWTAVTPADTTGRLAEAVTARYVRVDVQSSDASRRTGIRELEVIRAPDGPR
jgi:F5/8 type C domain-containing protein